MNVLVIGGRARRDRVRAALRKLPEGSTLIASEGRSTKTAAGIAFDEALSTGRNYMLLPEVQGWDPLDPPPDLVLAFAGGRETQLLIRRAREGRHQGAEDRGVSALYRVVSPSFVVGDEGLGRACQRHGWTLEQLW